MTVTSNTNGVPRSARSDVELIPWDPDSAEHLERMRLQRIECGWKVEWIALWQERQREGKVNLQWVVFTESDPDREIKLARHADVYPQESSSLVDSAKTFGGKPRESTGRSFIPVGHISLDYEYETAGKVENGPGIYWIATFYISRALQSCGLGRAAMDAVEAMAISEPLCATTLALSTRAKFWPEMEAHARAMQKPSPKFTLEDWYTRRGYVTYKYVDNMWWETDPTGQQWGCRAVFMKKNIER